MDQPRRISLRKVSKVANKEHRPMCPNWYIMESQLSIAFALLHDRQESLY